MNEKTLPDRDDEIVAHVAGRLPAAEREQIAVAAASDPQLASEIATLAAIRDELKRRSDSIHDDGQEFGWAKLSRAIDHERRQKNAAQTVNRWRAVAAVAAIACVAQGAFMLSTLRTGGARFETAATEIVRPYLAQVTFAPEAREGDVRALLIAAKGQIVEGPSGLGVYHIAFDDEDARKAGLAAFDASDEIVSFAAGL